MNGINCKISYDEFIRVVNDVRNSVSEKYLEGASQEDLMFVYRGIGEVVSAIYDFMEDKVNEKL